MAFYFSTTFATKHEAPLTRRPNFLLPYENAFIEIHTVGRLAFIFVIIIAIQGCAGSPARSIIQGDNTPKTYADRNMSTISLSRLCDMRQWEDPPPACDTSEKRRIGTFSDFCNTFADAVEYEFAIRRVLPELACSSRNVQNVLRNTPIGENPYRAAGATKSPSLAPKKIKKAPEIE